ncbi:hypothetical protein M407DRAFT_21931 [Tulasnella calospora MUT 4182]|uniref:SUN domain-containing protein n=1 Tax=Tulasnella calospora MUT 4182 TaxID=1051891 RepID=A0A0C3M5D2_9AGAM|nr:hypothetical protein M407DRAFT_21931 [Tulasnella calospora MUT 4182]
MKSLQFLSLLHLVARSTNTFQNDSTSNPAHDILCYYDPFYHLRLDYPPICSLSPKAGSADPTPEILSFEEWKAARQIAVESMHKVHSDPDNTAQHPNKSAHEEDERTGSSSTKDGSQLSGEDSSGGSLVQETKSQQVRVPLKDRFNYASQDCTARIHSSHKGGKSPSAILSSKKDRYMLSPCNSKNKFVVVELCDDVRIDTVQLANYEFFSGVFKDVKISLADSAPGDSLSWVDAGTYRAKNVRSVQSFHPLQGRQKFWRYIRVDFLSHYGNEYYCPVSLLRVYGLTHMEDYKWVGWQTDEVLVEAQTIKPEEAIVSSATQTQDNPSTQLASAQPQLSATEVSLPSSSQHVPTPTIRRRTDGSIVGDSTRLVPALIPAVPSTTEAKHSDSHVVQVAENVKFDEAKDRPHIPLPDASGKPLQPSRVQSSSSSQDASAGDGGGSGGSSSGIISVASPSADDTPSARLSSVVSSYSSATMPTTSSHASSSVIPSAPTPIFHPGGGESIYRTIMNRLHVLEMNSTLGIRYVEEQTRSLRDVVRKLEEDLGRLDELGKRQQRLFERAVVEMEKQRQESDFEIRKLVADVQTLAREITLEKRLGFLQLCLLICAFIFMGLTRGSRDQNFAPQPSAGSIRRSDSIRSGDWTRSRGHRQSQDVIRPPRRYSGSGPKTSPKPQISFHRNNPSAGDPFILSTTLDDGGPSTSYHFPPSQAHAQHTNLARLNRHTRQRVISSPSLPIKLRHSSPRRMAPHLHEVKPIEPSRRRFQIDLGEEEDEEGGTPRVRRTLPSEGHVIPFPLGSVKGKESSASDQAREERETSPSSTAAGDDISSDEAGVWEDTSTEGGDEEGLDAPGPDEPGPQSRFSPSPVSVRCETNQSVETLRLGQV